MPDPAPDTGDLRAIVDAARGVWTRRLIDYSRANSLLFYRDLKVGTLDLTAAPDAVDRLLAGDALTGPALVPARGGERAARDPLARRLAEDRVEQQTKAALLALQRKALSNLEEKGIETLHLAIGLATWPAADGGRAYAAPVLLVPARIEARGRTGDELRVVVTGEAQINPVLLHVLEESHAVRIDGPALLAACSGDDDSGEPHVDREGVLARVEIAAKTLAGFSIERRAILANFQFAKMAMVEDLKKHGDAIASSALVAAVAGHAASRQRLAQAAVDVSPARLDERPPDEDFLVLDADSTQHRVIALVGQAQNGVVQGPPGTGKSQTIANLIAQSVAEGRRVLFVAEKRAALDAVVKRLSHGDVDLAHLVLDLHGASVSRREVMARLARTLDEIRHAAPAEGADAVHRELEARRRQLNEHARRVNAPRPPTGLSVNRIIGLLLALPAEARSEVRLRGEVLAAIGAERADQIGRWLVEGSANAELLLGTSPSPWNDAKIADGAQAQRAIDLARRAAGELWPAFERALAPVVVTLGARAPATLADVGEILAVLSDARQVRTRYRAEIFSAGPGDLARALSPATGSAIARAWARLTNGAYRAARARLLSLRTAPVDPATLRREAIEADDVLRRWRALSPASPVPVEADADGALQGAFHALDAAATALAAIAPHPSLAALSLDALAAQHRALAADQRTPYLLPSVYALRAHLQDAGLSPFLDDLRAHRVPAEHWPARFRQVWLHSAFDHALASEPALAAFNGRAHEQVVAEFARLDRERVRLAARRVRRIHAERAVATMNEHAEQADLVRREAAKKTRHLPLRDLLSRAPDVLTRVAPCWVASPLSVSQLLDGGKRHFDVAIFDEASQIPQEDAIPALYRAGHVVVAGDRHQLPPTTFFATAVEGEDDVDGADDARATAHEAIGGFESLLDTLGAFLPNWLLEWHYRSEDERLIAFSNAHVYGGRLVTFPSARGHEAIRHVLVPHDRAAGGQEESASREVDEVVRLVLEHAHARPDESLGVITMGIRHANRVQAALDRALEDRPELADFFSLDREERFFVKNLETVQGDERDAIVLSIGYGKSPDGDLPHRFGPLTHDAGYRRLNVAVTRARRRLCVVSSFAHDEIDLARSGGRGVTLLKAYLEYAASGARRLPEPEHAGEVPLNPFEADVRDALEARGIKMRAQFGASRYRIDLVALHPRKAGRPVLAIECDGAAYHSGATARDRDRLRQAHLERLGWRFHRVWSTDWFYGREEETARALAAFEDAVRRADAQDAEDTMRRERDEPRAAPAGTVAARPSESGTAPSRETDAATAEPSPPKAGRRGPRPELPRHDSIEDYRDAELLRLAQWVASDGLLRTDEEAIRALFDELPFERLGSRIRNRLEAIVRGMRERR